MQATSMILRWDVDTDGETWSATTLERLGRDEEFLEKRLANTPGLLQLESLRTGIRGPYVVFPQVRLETPQGRAVRPDITILSASGHLIVVEVKLFGNPELQDRRVLAQVIDYAACFTALTAEQLVRALGGADGTEMRWPAFVQRLFPSEESPGELAEVLLARVQSGNLNLIIVCDRAPAGLDELVKGVARQSALEFDLQLVEVAPYTCRTRGDPEVIFVPRTRLVTEVVARTAVTVTYRQGDAPPSIEVQTTPIEEIEEGVQRASQGEVRSGRDWTDEEVVEAIEGGDDPTAIALLRFATEHSAGGQIVAPGRKVHATFGFFVKAAEDDGGERTRQLFRCSAGDTQLYLYLNSARRLASKKDVFGGFRERLEQTLGEKIDTSREELWISLSVVSESLAEFQDLMLWFAEAVGTGG